MLSKLFLFTPSFLASTLATLPSAVLVAQVSSPPPAEILIEKAYDSNVNVGESYGAGAVVHANGPRYFKGRFSNGGEVFASIKPYGIYSLNLFPNSSASITRSGLTAAGGRYLRITVKGKVRASTFRHNPNSQIEVCFGGTSGCSFLESSVKIRELDSGRFVIGVTTGLMTLFDDKELSKVPVPAGYYSIMEKNGIASTPKKPTKGDGIRIETQTKAVKALRITEGYEVQVGGKTFTSWVQIPNGLPYTVISPLN